MMRDKFLPLLWALTFVDFLLWLISQQTALFLLIFFLLPLWSVWIALTYR